VLDQVHHAAGCRQVDKADQPENRR
jgi:hypothetical protein